MQPFRDRISKTCAGITCCTEKQGHNADNQWCRELDVSLINDERSCCIDVCWMYLNMEKQPELQNTASTVNNIWSAQTWQLFTHNKYILLVLSLFYCCFLYPVKLHLVVDRGLKLLRSLNRQVTCCLTFVITPVGVPSDLFWCWLRVFEWLNKRFSLTTRTKPPGKWRIDSFVSLNNS